MSGERVVSIGTFVCPDCGYTHKVSMGPTEAREMADQMIAAAQLAPGQAFSLPPLDGLGVKGGSDGHVG